MEKLTIKNLACKRGSNLVFEKISFEIKSGQTFLIKGSNGSGKTSLIRTIAGFITSSFFALKINKTIPLEIIIFGSLIAMIVELIPNKKLNDNITIPIISALSIQLSLMLI